MGRMKNKVKFIENASLLTIILLALMGFGFLPAQGIVSLGSVPANNSSLEMPSNCSWTGNWNTYFGNMSLVQTGDKVVGTYEADGGRINGTVVARALVGNWSDAPDYSSPGHAGNLEFNLSDNCSSFSGRWRYGSEGNWSTDWSGTRVLSA